MRGREHFIKNRILLLMLLPVLIVGFTIGGWCVLWLTPPITSFVRNRTDAELKLASSLGFEICEESFNYLMDLRLENDSSMIAALKKESVEEIKKILKDS